MIVPVGHGAPVEGSSSVVFNELGDGFGIVQRQEFDRLGVDGASTQGVKAVHLVGDGLSGQSLGDTDDAVAFGETMHDE